VGDPNKVTYFAETDARNSRTPFGIKAKDRAKHTYVIGKTGMGKSTLLLNMAIQDVRNGNGVVVIDPHGSFAEELLEFVPEERIKDVLYFAPFDLEYPISFNVMEDVGYDRRHIVASGLMSAFKKIWQDAWSARMEYILSNTILALLEYPNATLLSVNRMLADKSFREDVVSTVTDPGVRSFWVNEFANYTERFAAEATPAIQNKVGQFTSNPVIRNILGQPKSSFDIREMMDSGKILIANLSKGRIGEVASTLLGSLFVTKTYLSAMSRADVSPETLKGLPDCYLYVDEFQTFANESFADILSEARKYKLALTIAHQYVEQMPEEVRSAVFGNVGTMIVFRVGSFDAEVFEKEFAPVFLGQDIVNLGFAQVYLRLMIDGVGSKPFSAKTLGPMAKPAKSFVAEIVDASRQNYARSRAEVEKAFVADLEATVEAQQAEAAAKKKPKFGPKPGGGGGYGDGRPPRRDEAPRPPRAADRPAPAPQRAEEEWDGFKPKAAPAPAPRPEPSRAPVAPIPETARPESSPRAEAPREPRPAPVARRDEPRPAAKPAAPVPAPAPKLAPRPERAANSDAKAEIVSFLRDVERDAGVAPVGDKRRGPKEVPPAPPEPIHLAELLKRPPGPGEVRKDADEDRKAALRAMLEATMGGQKPAAQKSTPAASVTPAPAPAPRPVVQAPRPEARPAVPPVAAPAPQAAAPSASGATIAAAAASFGAAQPAARPAPRGIPDDELRAILDAED
jgi:energy-coupling factor transporter ATP-binding protein EcfA2